MRYGSRPIFPQDCMGNQLIDSSILTQNYKKLVDGSILPVDGIYFNIPMLF